MNDLFRRFSHKTAELLGTPWAFVIALLSIVVWATTGPLFSFSDTWQLVVNTGTTVITFLMVFIIQNTQNRDARAIHLKLDELIKGVKGARSGLVDLEDMTDEDLDRLKQEFQALHEQAVASLEAVETEEGTREEREAEAQEAEPQGA